MTIVDLDNCLADDRWRRRWLPTPDQHMAEDAWHRYHEGLYFDPCHNQHVCGAGAIIFTARPERYRVDTIRWLTRHQLLTPHLYMRPAYDRRDSVEVKRTMLLSLSTSLLDQVTMAYDDRQDIIDMYRAHGLTAQRLSIDMEDTR